MVTAMLVIFSGSLIALRMSETDRESLANARHTPIQRNYFMKQQEEYLRNACLDGKEACDKAQEEIQTLNCELFGSDCIRNPRRR